MSCIHVVQHLNTTGNTATTPFPSLIFQNLKHTSYVVHKRFCVLLRELKTFKKNIYTKYVMGFSHHVPAARFDRVFQNVDNPVFRVMFYPHFCRCEYFANSKTTMSIEKRDFIRGGVSMYGTADFFCG